MQLEIAHVELVNESHYRAFVSARIEPAGILLQNFRIAVCSATGKLYLQSPYYKKDDKKHAVIRLPREMREELKRLAFAAYLTAGGKEGVVAHDAPNSRERRSTARKAG